MHRFSAAWFPLFLLLLQAAKWIGTDGGAARFLVEPADDLGNLFVDPLHLAEQLGGGHPQNAAAQGGELDQSVGGRDADGVIFSDLVCQRFDILIGTLSLLRVNDAEIALFCA